MFGGMLAPYFAPGLGFASFSLGPSSDQNAKTSY